MEYLKHLKTTPVSQTDLNRIQRWIEKINAPNLEKRQCLYCGFVASHETNLYPHIKKHHPSFSNKRKKSIKNRNKKRKSRK